VKKYWLFNSYLPVPVQGPDALREVRPLILFSILTAGSYLTVRQKTDEQKGEKNSYCQNSCINQEGVTVWGFYSLSEPVINFVREGKHLSFPPPISIYRIYSRRNKILDFTV